MDHSVSELRPRLMAVAYRMLGSVADAEDAVQDAFLRLQTSVDVASPEGFLVKTTTQRCIDQLRSCQRRKRYVGPWVPEPVDTRRAPHDASLRESLSQAFLLMLERLSPNERAVFLLRSVFDYEYAEISEVVGKSEVYVRQIYSRSQAHLKRSDPRSRPVAAETRNKAEDLAERFVAACREGDARRVEQLFAEDAEVYSDGGGKVSAARVVIRGRNRAARFLAGVFSRYRRNCQMCPASVNGLPGVVFFDEGAVVQVVALRIEDAVQEVYMTLNPDKLARWSYAEIE